MHNDIHEIFKKLFLCMFPALFEQTLSGEEHGWAHGWGPERLLEHGVEQYRVVMASLHVSRNWIDV